MTSKKIILIGVAVVALLGAGGTGAWFFFPEFLPTFIRPQIETRKQTEKEQREPEITADLDTFVVNLAGSSGGRYLRTSLSLGIRGNSEHGKEQVKELLAPIRHSVIMYLSAQSAEDLLNPEGKEKIRKDILERINKAIGKKTISTVYFKEFLIQ